MLIGRENHRGGLGGSCGARLSGCHGGDISTRAWHRSAAAASRKRGMAPLWHPAAGLSPGQGDTQHLGLCWSLGWSWGAREMSVMEKCQGWMWHHRPQVGAKMLPELPAHCVWFWFPLRHPRLHPGYRNSWQGMRNKPGGQGSPDGMNSTDCKLLPAFEFRAWSLLDSSSERRLRLLKAIYKRQSTI